MGHNQSQNSRKTVGKEKSRTLALAAGRDVAQFHLLAVQHSELPDANDRAVDHAPVSASAGRGVDTVHTSACDWWNLADDTVVQHAFNLSDVAFVLRTEPVQPLCELDPEHLTTCLTSAVSAAAVARCGFRIVMRREWQWAPFLLQMNVILLV